MDRISEIVQGILKAPPHTITEQPTYDINSKEYTERECNVYNSLDGKLTGYDCTLCKNRGCSYEPRFNEISNSWAPVAIECRCMSIRAEIARRQQSGLSKLMKKYTFQNYKADEQWQLDIAKGACNYVRKPEGWFFIGGQPGSGKTHICTAIVNSLLKKGYSARYMVWTDEITAIKQAATDADKYGGIIRGLQKSEVLYIDDFFKKPKGYTVTGADIDNTFRIINYRYNEELPTIISSELSISKIIEIDEALGSRIAEMSKGSDYFVEKDSTKNYRYRSHA